MNKNEQKALVAIIITLLAGVGVAWAGSQRSVTVGDFPLFALLVALAFAIQIIAFVPAYLLQTERFFDLTGSLTYISLTLLAVALAPQRDARAIVVAGLVVLWAARLGTFLFRRVLKAGKDGRFDDLKPSLLRFLNVWTLQGLWITFTAAAAWVAISTKVRAPFGVLGVIGALIWALGLGLEATADAQKNRFRADPANKGRFIQTGLWARSRHPNYFGEITLWVGMAIIALPVLRGWSWIALLSPIFVTLLLTRISGVPMLEKRADERWGGQPDYEAYKARTPALLPRLGTNR